MGKHEVGTPKYIANKIKAKGLQKLRWYCQMCQKQCRDENGFKCHSMSESHQRQLLLFADNPNRFLNDFSRQFQREFLDLLKCQFGTKRVPANKVYQDYISDRKHLHMNATEWETLTDFVKWLGRECLCVVDETEKGWFITYIDKDPEMIRLQDTKAKKEKMSKDDEEKMYDFLQKQIEIGKKSSTVLDSQPTELQKDENEISLTINFKKDKRPKETTKVIKPSIFDEKKTKGIFKKPAKKSEKRSVSALESIIIEEQRKKRKLMNQRNEFRKY